jgi:polar amino acid transport system substrate-binding protein
MSKKLLICLLIVIGAILVAGYFFFQPTSKEETEDPLLQKIKSKGKIVIGLEANYPPMESIDQNGNFTGIDIEIAKEIASDLKVKPEFKNISWDKLFDALLQGEVDILISAITITPERSEKMAFSDPYFNAGQVIVTTLNRNDIKGVNDLKGKKIGVQIDTTSETEAKKYTDPNLVISFQDYVLAKESLLKGEIDAIIIDYPAAIGIVSEEKNLIIVGEPFTQEFYGIALRKEDKTLLNKINQTLRRLKREGTIKEIEQKWLSE